MTDEQTYRIVNLTSENVMRLHAVNITPDGDIVELTGDNAAGKSSVLNSIFMALAGGSAIPSDPINHDADHAVIALDLGPIKVTRKFKRNDTSYTTSLHVESADGASYKRPQDMLNALIPAISFDPLEFSRMKPRDQYDALRSFVPSIDFKLIEDQNRGDFERRAEYNKRHQEAKAQAAIVVINNDLPDDEIDENELLDKIAAAGGTNAALKQEAEHRAQRAEDIQHAKTQVEKYRLDAADFRKRFEAMQEAAISLQKQIEADEANLATLAPIAPPVDVLAARAALLQAQATNANIRAAAEARRRKASLEKVAQDAAQMSDELSAKMKARNDAKHAAIAAAKMPVAGLGFGADHVTLNNVPFSQASSAEQLAASVAISMSKNSQLRVIMIRDGSLLDATSWQLIAKMAAENGFQVWAESVFAHSKAAIVIEDGAVKTQEASTI